MQPITVTAGPLTAASANNIALSQTVTGAAAVVLNGSLVTSGVAYLGTPRRILITNVGNDSGITFTIVGTTYGGTSISQTVTGTSGSTVATTLDFLTVTSITTSGSTSASGITVGTNTVGGSRWVRTDSFALPSLSIQIDVSGTINYTLQSTNDDPNDPFNPVSINNVAWFDSTDSAVVSASASKQTSFTNAPTYIRLVVNSGTGTATATIIQYGNAPY